MNNECMQIHETALRDIFDIIQSAKDFDGVEWLNKRNNTGSIAKRASNLVLVFPAIVSSSNSIESSMIACKALERKCVALLQILFSSMQLVDGIDNLNDYIAQFHSNLNSKMTLDDFMGFMDSMSESGMIQITDPKAYEMVKEDMHNIGFEINHSLNSVSLNDYVVTKTPIGENAVVMETHAINPLNEAPIRSGNSFMSKEEIEYMKMVNAQLLPMDVKKANELMPTIMTVNFIAVKDGRSVVVSNGLIGVKVKMYPVDALEIVNRLTSKVKDKNGLFNLVRATTREISFFKDLAFGIDKAKLDAVNLGNDSDNAKMFRILERRAAKNKFMSLIRKNDASPITSLIISQDDVEYIIKYHNMDLRKPYILRTILNSYNLMSIVIMDESLEIARFLFDDGDGEFETLTYNALEKEAADNSYKKVVNLMSKMNR